MAESRTRHFISDRRLENALNSPRDGHDVQESIRELLDEAWNRGYSAGQFRGKMQEAFSE